MAFTAGEVANIANSALDFYYNRGDTFKQSIQSKPFLKWAESSAKSFPGGKGSISLSIKGDYGAGGVNDKVVGYTHNDTVAFYTPANIKRANFPWREHHIGLTLTHTELKVDGISVTDDEGNGTGLSKHSDREVTVLVNLLQDKLEDFGEQYARSMNTLLWGDGTGDAKALAGMRSIILAVPNTGTTGGLDRVANTWWRNKAATAAFGAAGGRGPITSSDDRWRRAAVVPATGIPAVDPLWWASVEDAGGLGLYHGDGDRDPRQRQLQHDRLRGHPGRRDGTNEVRRHHGRIRSDLG
jgi:hypothetical protein